MTDERPVLVLLHDEGRGPDQWRDFVGLFETSYRLVVPDLSEDGRPERVRALVGDEPFAVIGHGTGGALAQSLAASGGVAAMVLIDAPRAEGVDDDALAAFGFPVLLLWGEDDADVPVGTAEQLNEAIPTSTLGLVPGVGHDLPGEAAATIAPIVYEYLRARHLRVSHGHDHGHDGIVRIQLERRPPWVDLAEDEHDDWFVEDEEEGAT
jgi:pimeloyl-ACP methyl ester carboxylesterase